MSKHITCGKVQNAFINDDIKELIKALHNGSDSVVYSKLSYLRKKYGKNSTAIQLLLKNGGIKILLKYIEKPKLSDLALSIVANYCLDPLWRKEFLKEDGVTCLVRILQGLAPDTIQNRACRALANVGLDRYGHKIIHDKKGLPKVLNFLSSTDSPECQQTALRTLRILANSVDHRKELCKLSGVQTVVKLLKSDVLDVVKSSVKTVSSLTYMCSKECAEQVQNNEGPSSLISLSSHNSDEIKKDAVLSLVNLSSQSCIRAELGKVGTVELFINIINESQLKSPGLSGIIESLCLFCQESVNRNRIRELGGLKLLVSILSDPLYFHFHSCVMSAFLFFKYDEHSLESLLSLGLIEIVTKHLKEYTEKCKNECEEERKFQTDDINDNLNMQFLESKFEYNDPKKSLNVRNSNLNTCVGTDENNMNYDKNSNKNCADRVSLKENNEISSGDTSDLFELTEQITPSTSKVFSINSPSYQEMRNCHSELPYTQPLTIFSPGREFPGSPLSTDSAYYSNLGSFSPSSNVSYMSFPCDDNLSEFSSAEDDDGDEIDHSKENSLEEFNDSESKKGKMCNADLRTTKGNTECAHKNIRKLINWFSICSHENLSEEELIQSALNDILDKKNIENSYLLFPSTSDSENSVKKYPEIYKSSKTLLCKKYTGSAKKRLWNDESCIDDYDACENKRKKQSRSISLDDDWTVLKVPDINHCVQNLKSSDDTERSVKENKTTSLETLIVQFLYHLSHIDELNLKLTTELCLHSLMKYLSEHSCPSHQSEKILLTLSNNPLTFEKLISIGFVKMILEIFEREHFSRICERCKNLDRLKKQLFSNLRNIAESGFGTGVLQHFFYTGAPDEQVYAFLSIPYIVRKIPVLYKLLVEVPGLELLTNLLKSGDNDVAMHTLQSLLTLCQTLIDQKNLWRVPESDMIYSGTKLRCLAISKKSATSKHICKYESDSANYDVWFSLENKCKIGANRLTLCENSVYFSALLDGYFIESIQSELLMTDISTEALVIIFHYLYGCHSESCNAFHITSLDLLLELICFCDRFLLPDFQEIILHSIINHLSPETVQIIYIHSKEYHINDLKTAALNYLLAGTMGKIMCLSILDELFHSSYHSEILNDINDVIKNNLTVGPLSNFAFNTS